MLFDVKPICKKLDTRIDELIDIEHRAAIKGLLKRLNGFEDGGVQGAQRMIQTLQGIDIDVTKYEDAVSDAKATRSKGRLIITCRTAAIMVKSGTAPDLKKFKAECAAFGVTLPKELIDRLDNL